MKRFFTSLFALIPLIGLAGGFQVNLQGNQQAGMGHLGTSFYLGASSAYFNPAMIGLSENKFDLEVGASGILAYVAFQNQNTGNVSETDNPLGTPFYAYGTYKINDNLTAGLAIYTPFGSSVDWGKDWEGKYLIQDISLQSVFIQPTFSIDVNDKFSVGLGLIYATGSVEINRALAFQNSSNNQSSASLSGSASGYGTNVGFYYKPIEKLSMGLTYRSAMKMELEDGDAKFEVPDAVSATVPRNNSFSTTLELPRTYTFGLAYQLNEKLLISAEYSYVDWTPYKSLDFDFETNTAGFPDSENPRRYEVASIFRLGFQYQVNDKVIARIGGYYDESPVEDDLFNPETPNSDNIGLTAGVSLNISDKFSIDGSFIYIDGQERESYYTANNVGNSYGEDFGGKYKSRSFIPGLGLRYNF